MWGNDITPPHNHLIHLPFLSLWFCISCMAGNRYAVIVADYLSHYITSVALIVPLSSTVIRNFLVLSAVEDDRIISSPTRWMVLGI